MVYEPVYFLVGQEWADENCPFLPLDCPNETPRLNCRRRKPVNVIVSGLLNVIVLARINYHSTAFLTNGIR
jgi:hypothetical protein